MESAWLLDCALVVWPCCVCGFWALLSTGSWGELVGGAGPCSKMALLRRASLSQDERPEDGGAEGLDHNQGLNRLMLAVGDMMANFHFHDLEAP